MPRILRWEAATIAREGLLLTLSWGEVRIGVDIQYWINARKTAIIICQPTDQGLKKQSLVEGTTLPCYEPNIGEVDSVFEAVAKYIAMHWPKKRLVRSAPKYIGTSMGDDADDDRIPVTYDISPGDFEFSNTTM